VSALPLTADALRQALRQWDGVLTRELVLAPGKFGLGQVPERLAPDATTTSVCGYCSTGCGLNIHFRNGEAVNLSATTEYPVNLGMACPKGWEALSVLRSNDRATTPLLRNPLGKMQPVSWDRALTELAGRFKAIQAAHGPDAVAWIGTGQIPTEELALLGAIAKFGMGFIHGDGNTRQCMATAATAYKQSFGFDAPPFTYNDFEESDALIFVGANPCIAHPILWERVLRNRRNPALVVIDPRKTETAQAATLHLQLQPKSDLDLFYGVAAELLRRGWIKQDFIDAHTRDFATFAEFLHAYTLERTAQVTGLPAAQIVELAQLIYHRERVSFWWTMGVNQSHQGTRTAQALINLALMTGNIGRPGTGANSITGQCNAMGSRLFSNTTNLLGGRDFTNAQDRADVARLLNLDVARIPNRGSWAYNEIIDAVRAGTIKGLWIFATNTAHSWINQNDFYQLARKLDFLVVQDMYANTDTAQLAHLVLPAAGWGEKEGTFINSERRFGLTKKVAHAPGLALADFHIFKLAAHYWGCSDLFAEWADPESVFRILQRLSRGHPCDITGIDGYAMLDKLGGVQWPLPAGANPGDNQRRLFADGKFFTDDGRAKFIFEAPVAAPECADTQYPFTLLTGRGTSAQWHTGTRTSKSATLRTLYPKQLYVEVHPLDAAELHINNGETVEVASRRGRLTARAVFSVMLQRKQVFLPMHYAEVNRLTASVFDPYSKQPSYKSGAVALRKAAADDIQKQEQAHG
jgi:anaerobic selenocysteine-containing dehydrogenase